MAEASPAATPRSIADPNSQPKYSAPKDKECPFCHQHFTSSSLGRHLDLYIRERNPKEPDGIHIVEEIREIRGNITRRQSRPSLRRQLSAAASTKGKKQESVAGDKSPVIVHSPSSQDGSIVSGKTRKSLSEVWQASNAKSRTLVLDARTPDVRRRVSRHNQQKAELEERKRNTEDCETTKAMEMALKELLKSVKEAK